MGHDGTYTWLSTSKPSIMYILSPYRVRTGRGGVTGPPSIVLIAILRVGMAPWILLFFVVRIESILPIQFLACPQLLQLSRHVSCGYRNMSVSTKMNLWNVQAVGRSHVLITPCLPTRHTYLASVLLVTCHVDTLPNNGSFPTLSRIYLSRHSS